MSSQEFNQRFQASDRRLAQQRTGQGPGWSVERHRKEMQRNIEAHLLQQRQEAGPSSSSQRDHLQPPDGTTLPSIREAFPNIPFSDQQYEQGAGPSRSRDTTEQVERTYSKDLLFVHIDTLSNEWQHGTKIEETSTSEEWRKGLTKAEIKDIEDIIKENRQLEPGTPGKYSKGLCDSITNLAADYQIYRKHAEAIPVDPRLQNVARPPDTSGEAGPSQGTEDRPRIGDERTIKAITKLDIYNVIANKDGSNINRLKALRDLVPPTSRFGKKRNPDNFIEAWDEAAKTADAEMREMMNLVIDKTKFAIVSEERKLFF